MKLAGDKIKTSKTKLLVSLYAGKTRNSFLKDTVGTTCFQDFKKQLNKFAEENP